MRGPKDGQVPGARDCPTNTRHPHKVGLMFGKRRRRWTNIKPTLCECLVFSGTTIRSTVISYVKLLVIMFRNCHAIVYHNRPLTDFVWMCNLGEIKFLKVSQRVGLQSAKFYVFGR